MITRSSSGPTAPATATSTADAAVGRPRLRDPLGLRQAWALIAVSTVGQPVGRIFLYWLPKFFSARYPRASTRRDRVSDLGGSS